MGHEERHDENPSRDPENPSAEKDEKLGWIERIAKRSTGLPDLDRPQESPPESDSQSAWRYAGVGLQFAATTAVFVLMGYAIDRRMGWTPWGTVAMAMVGVIGGLYLLIKEALREDKPGPDKRGKT